MGIRDDPLAGELVSRAAPDTFFRSRRTAAHPRTRRARSHIQRSVDECASRGGMTGHLPTTICPFILNSESEVDIAGADTSENFLKSKHVESPPADHNR